MANVESNALREKQTNPAGSPTPTPAVLSSAERDVSKLIARERVRNRKNAFQHPNYLMEQRLSKAIINGNTAAAMETLDQINSLERATLAGDLLRSLKNSLIASCTFMTRAAIAGNVDSESAFMLSDIYIRAIEEQNTRQKLESLEYDMAIGFSTLVQVSEMRHVSPPIAKACRFILDNIMVKLSLAEIAEHVHLSPNYLTTIFTQELGQSVMSYYDEQRCAAIKEFLTTTDISITDIAAIFDFATVAHFSTYFKKHTGNTPSGCRQLQSL